GAELFLLVSVAQRREVGWKISPLIITANWVKCIYLSIASLATVVASITGILAIEGVVGMMALSLLLYLRWGIVRETMEFSPRGAVAMIGGLMVVYIGAAVLATILLAVLVVATGGEAFEAIANSV
ncbi:MAG: hypothetical protein HRU11_08365, partial [Parvularculaceae bacterium]|nr:hypothetical protein [Parvularculaceae bacterium]